MPTESRPFRLIDYQIMFGEIYGDANKHYSDYMLILRLIEEACSIMEIARKDHRDSFAVFLPRIFSWSNAVANRFNVDLQSALWHKYPGVCTYCLRDANCVCSVEHIEIPDREKKLRILRRDRTGKEPISLKEHQTLHARLYKRQNDRILLIQTAAHLVEECGEVSQAFRRKDKDKFQDELADVLSWIFGLATRIGFDLEELVWNTFPYECEVCSNKPCACPPNSV